jgi:hypothetical protein
MKTKLRIYLNYEQILGVLKNGVKALSMRSDSGAPIAPPRRATGAAPFRRMAAPGRIAG